MVHRFSGKSTAPELRVLREPAWMAMARRGWFVLLSFDLEELSLIDKSRQAAAMVDGLYSKKEAVRIVCRQRLLAKLSIW